MIELDVIEEVGSRGLPGPAGLSAFEQWKLETSNPSATWDDYQEANKGEDANEVEFYRIGNEVRWRYVGEPSTGGPVLNTIELGTGTMTEAERLSLLSPIEGTKVFQTNKAKGEYQFVNGKWFFIGNKTRKAIPQNVTLLLEDIGYVLESSLDIPGVECTVTIPSGIFVDGHTVLVAQMGASKIKFVAGAGMTIRCESAAVNNRTYNKYTEAMIRFISATECIITGGLE